MVAGGTVEEPKRRRRRDAMVAVLSFGKSGGLGLFGAGRKGEVGMMRQ
jgi:hypothetical protein